MKSLSPFSQKTYPLIAAGLACAALLTAQLSQIAAVARSSAGFETARLPIGSGASIALAAGDTADDSGASSGSNRAGDSVDSPVGAGDAPPANSNGLSPELMARIASLEARLFGEQHQGESPERRVAKIEKFVYGNATPGPIAERVQNLETAMLQKNPDGSSAAPLPSASSVPVIPPAGQPVPLPQVNIPSSNAAPGAAQDGSGPGQQVASSLPSSGGGSQAQAAAPPGEPLKLSLVKYRDIQQPKRVIQELNEAIDSDPNNNADLLFQRAKAYLELEDYDRALADLTDAIQKEPMRCQYYLVRACILNKLGKPFQAQKDIVRARFVNPTLPPDVQFDKDAGGQ